MYLNTIYFGHGAYGVEAASQAYFGKRSASSTLPEAAMIAGVIKSPGRYSPYLDPEAAEQRRDTVLAQMREQGYITEAAVRRPRSPPSRSHAGSKAAPDDRARTSSSTSRSSSSRSTAQDVRLPRRPARARRRST